MAQRPTEGFGFTDGQPFMSEFHGRAPWQAPALIPENVMKWMGPNSIKPEDVIGWFTVPIEQYKNIALQPFDKLFLIPCFWPGLVLFSPCIAMTYCSIMKTLPTVTFIVTKKAIMQFTEVSGPSTAACRGGRDNKITHFDKMQAIKSDNMEQGCVCFAVPNVSITLSTMHSTGGEHPQMVNDMVYVYCQDPDSSAAFLRSVMDEREDAIHGLGDHQKHVIVDGGGGGGSSGGGIADQIRALDALRDDGILTDAEFNSKKADLLTKM